MNGQSKEKRTLAYIMGPSYSGSTLLTFLMAQHPDIATVGELKGKLGRDLNTYKCSCGALQKDCGFWREVHSRMEQSDPEFSLGDFKTHFGSDSAVLDRLFRAQSRGALFEMVRAAAIQGVPGAREGLDRIILRNQRVIEVISNLQEARVFLDGSKDPARLRWLWKANRWNIRAIYLIRDGRGVTNSVLRHYGGMMAKAAQDWSRTQRRCDRMAADLGGEGCLTLHYEELCRNPEAEMDKVFRYLGVDNYSIKLRFRPAEQHILGNSMRLASASEISLDENWRTSLSPENQAVFDRVAGPLNTGYGYARKSSVPPELAGV